MEEFEQIKSHAGVVVKNLRMAFNKTCAELALSLKVDLSWLHDIEEERREVPFEDFQRICHALGTSAKEVLDFALRAKQSHFLA